MRPFVCYKLTMDLDWLKYAAALLWIAFTAGYYMLGKEALRRQQNHQRGSWQAYYLRLCERCGSYRRCSIEGCPNQSIVLTGATTVFPIALAAETARPTPGTDCRRLNKAPAVLELLTGARAGELVMYAPTTKPLQLHDFPSERRKSAKFICANVGQCFVKGFLSKSLVTGSIFSKCRSA